MTRTILGDGFFLQGEDFQWVEVKFVSPKASDNDWIAVFSPANFKFCPLLFHFSSWMFLKRVGLRLNIFCLFYYGSSSTCPATNIMQEAPYICSAPIKVWVIALSHFNFFKKFFIFNSFFLVSVQVWFWLVYYGSSSTCPATNIMQEAPYICSAPIKVWVIALSHFNFFKKIFIFISFFFCFSTSLQMIPTLVIQKQAKPLWNFDWSINGKISHLLCSQGGYQMCVILLFSFSLLFSFVS